MAEALAGAEIDTDLLLATWESLAGVQADADACRACRGLESCTLENRGMPACVSANGPLVSVGVRPCRFMAPVLERGRRNSRLSAARLERRFWDRSFSAYQPRNKDQETAMERCKTWAAMFTPGQTKTGLFMVGPVGTGKTHLAAAIVIEAMERYPNLTPLFLPMVDFMEELREAVADRESSVNDLVDQAVRAPLLALDDLGGSLEWENVQNGRRRLLMNGRGQHPVTDFERRTLYRLVNRRYEAGLPTILTTNCTPDVLEQAYGDRTMSRLFEATDGLMVPGADYRKSKLMGQIGTPDAPADWNE